MNRGKFCRLLVERTNEGNHKKTDLHSIGGACLHALVLGVDVGRKTLLELGLHVRGAWVTVIPVAVFALSGDHDRQALGQERDCNLVSVPLVLNYSETLTEQVRRDGQDGGVVAIEQRRHDLDLTVFVVSVVELVVEREKKEALLIKVIARSLQSFRTKLRRAVR
jgi:hypothetical protein